MLLRTCHRKKNVTVIGRSVDTFLVVPTGVDDLLIIFL